MFTSMQTPKTRAEFERAFYFAMEQMREGKLRLPMGADDYVHSLRSVRHLPNGRLDFLSVDERARLHANMTLNMMAGPFRDGFGEEIDQGTSRRGDQTAFTDDALTQPVKQKASKKKVVPKAAAKKKTSSRKDAKKTKTKKKTVRKASKGKRKME